MRNLKISAKLIVGFGTVLIMVIILGIVAINGIGSLNKTVNLYATKTLPDTEYIWEIRRDMVSVERYLTEAIAATDQTKASTSINKSASESQALTQAVEKYKANARTDPSLMASYESILAEASKYRKQITDLLQQPNADQNKAGVMQIFETQYAPAYEAANNKLLEIAAAVQTLAEEQKQDAQSAGLFAKTLVFIVAIFAAAITVIMVVLIRKSILAPVQAIENAARKMAAGTLDANIEYQSNDELGMLADNLRHSIHTIQAYIDDIDRAMGELANGNFEIAPSQPFIGDFKSIEDSISKMIMEMSKTIFQINKVAGNVSGSSSQVSASSQMLAQGATEQASAVEELSASITEVSEQVNQNAKNAIRASEMATIATDSISESNRQMQQLMVSMNDIDAKSKEISKIIKTIEDIAFQTNILALNAAVEAARAGSAGKGFAVVADEVRNLAGKSAEAAKNTTDLIEDSITAINEGVSLAQVTANDLMGVVNGVTETTTVIKEISKATNEQALAITQLTIGLEQISTVVQINSATSQESAAASDELSAQAARLKGLIARFQLSKAVLTQAHLSDNQDPASSDSPFSMDTGGFALSSFENDRPSEKY